MKQPRNLRRILAVLLVLGMLILTTSVAAAAKSPFPTKDVIISRLEESGYDELTSPWELVVFYVFGGWYWLPFAYNNEVSVWGVLQSVLEGDFYSALQYENPLFEHFIEGMIEALPISDIEKASLYEVWDLYRYYVRDPFYDELDNIVGEFDYAFNALIGR